MRKLRGLVAAALTALLLVPGAVLANPDQKQDDSDGHSRYEVAPLSFLPLALLGGAQERIAKMYILMRQASYLIEMTTGVKATNQNRISLGGLFGNVLAKTYSPEDFLKSLEVGTVYRAGNGLLAVAMEGDERLQDHKVIVFNGDFQYDPQALPSLQQIEPAQLNKLQAFSLMMELSSHILDPGLVSLVARLGGEDSANRMANLQLTSQQQTEIPYLRELIVGKVYRGANNTLLVVIPPAIVLDR